MVAPYAGTKLIPAERVSTAIFIPVTNSLERLKKEVNRRADVVGIFPNEAAIIRLIGTVLLQRNDEWQLQRPAFGKCAVVKLL
jgi:transposase-like protein